MSPATDEGFLTDIKDISWSKLQSFVGNINLTQIKQDINAALGPDLGPALGDALDALQQAASNPTGNSATINLAFPFIDHPAQAVFGLLIGVIACYKGFTATRGAIGVGTATTSSVVTSITSVIACDTVCNIILTRLWK